MSYFYIKDKANKCSEYDKTLQIEQFIIVRLENKITVFIVTQQTTVIPVFAATYKYRPPCE